jgi:hypothetical protein
LISSVKVDCYSISKKLKLIIHLLQQ